MNEQDCLPWHIMPKPENPSSGDQRHLFATKADIGDVALVERLLAEHQPWRFLTFASRVSVIVRSMARKILSAVPSAGSTRHEADVAATVFCTTDGRRLWLKMIWRLPGVFINKPTLSALPAAAASGSLARAYHHTPMAAEKLTTNCSKQLWPATIVENRPADDRMRWSVKTRRYGGISSICDNSMSKTTARRRCWKPW
jgi:hypothetical protein